MDRKAFEPYHMMFEELKGINKAAHLKMLLQSNEKTPKNCNTLGGGGGGELLVDFRFPQGVLKPNLDERRELHYGLSNCRVEFPKYQTPLNRLKTKRRPLYLKTQSVPRSKHFSSLL